jgi:hypothetical protein
MCLITEQKEPIVLKRKKTVYKVLTSDLRAPVQDFTYELNKLYKTDIIANDTFESWADNKAAKAYPDAEWGNYTNVHAGFHSLKTKKMCDSWMWAGNAKFECTIPAGSLYYEDKTGLCASNQIIINKIL